MRGFLGRICVLYGYPVCVNSLPLRFLSALIAVSYSSTFIWKRYLVNIFFPSPKSTISLDKMAVLTKVNFYEMLTILATNFCHIFALVMQSETYNDIFKNGKVFYALKTSDKFVIVLCLSDFCFVFAMNETMSNVVRYLAYCFVISLGHLKIFQFCSVLLHYSAAMAGIMKSIHCHPNSTVWVVSCLQRYHQLVAGIHTLNSVFGFQILVSFSTLWIYMVYLPGWLYVMYVDDKLPLGYNLYCCHLILARVVLLLYMSQCVSRAKRLGDDFILTLFHTTRRRDSPKFNRVLHLYMKSKESVKLTACDFFYFENPILAPLMASVASYLVILLQFQVPK